VAGLDKGSLPLCNTGDRKNQKLLSTTTNGPQAMTDKSKGRQNGSHVGSFLPSMVTCRNPAHVWDDATMLSGCLPQKWKGKVNPAVEGHVFARCQSRCRELSRNHIVADCDAPLAATTPL